jgi:hypothetical protein
VVAVVILSLPMLPEFQVTISPPQAIRSWAVDVKWEVRQFVSVPLLLAPKALRAQGALPWTSDGALDRGGRRRDSGLRLREDRILVRVRSCNDLRS